MSENSIQRFVAVLLRVGTVQAIVQLAQIGAGIWIIRSSTKEEYTYYTIANTVLFTAVLLADSGVTASLSARSGKAWQDQRRLGTLLVSGLRMRRELSVIVGAIAVPLLIALLVRNGASLTKAVIIAALATVTSIGELMVHTYLVVFRQRKQFNYTQRTALIGTGGRILWLALWMSGQLQASMALLASSVNTVLQLVWLRRRIGEHADMTADPDPTVEQEMKELIRKQAPLNIYYSVQGQITIWLASAFGTSHAVSDVGALGRFSALFTVSLAVLQEVILPAFSRAQSPNLVFRRYVQITSGYIVFLTVAVALILAVPDSAMALLGKQYSSLAPQLPLAMAYSSIYALTQVLWNLNYSRAWIQPPLPYILATTLIQVGLFKLFHSFSVHEILWFTVLSLIPSVVFPVLLSIRRIRSLERESATPPLSLTAA